MIEPDYRTLGKPDPKAIADNRLAAATLQMIRAALDELTRERDAARAQRDSLAQRCLDLEACIFNLRADKREEARSRGHTA